MLYSATKSSFHSTSLLLFLRAVEKRRCASKHAPRTSANSAVHEWTSLRLMCLTGGIAGSHTAVIERLKLRDSVPMAVIGPSGFSNDDTAASICVHSAPTSFFAIHSCSDYFQRCASLEFSISSVSARKYLNVDLSIVAQRLDLFYHSPSSDKTRGGSRRSGEIYDRFSLSSAVPVYRPGVQQ